MTHADSKHSKPTGLEAQQRLLDEPLRLAFLLQTMCKARPTPTLPRVGDVQLGVGNGRNQFILWISGLVIYAHVVGRVYVDPRWSGALSNIGTNLHRLNLQLLWQFGPLDHRKCNARRRGDGMIVWWMRRLVTLG